MKVILRWAFSTQLWATYTSGRGRLEGSKREGDEVRRRRRRESGDQRRRGSEEGSLRGRRESWDDHGEDREKRDRTAIIRRQKETSRLIDPFFEYSHSPFQ